MSDISTQSPETESPASGDAACPLCLGPRGHYATIRGFAFFECQPCDFISVSAELLRQIDEGLNVRKYDETYWNAERTAARDRCYGPALSRFAELLLYARVPVEKFIDIGTGTGDLLDSLSFHLPSNAWRFYGVEKFPPPPDFRTRHRNYIVGDLRDAPGLFQAGLCVEVVEHLTPAMVRGVALQLGEISVEGSIFLFNTGLTDYVRIEDPGYLDADIRGHICVWSVRAIAPIFEAEGFKVHAIPGKRWAFLVEKVPAGASYAAIPDRIWTRLPENEAILRDPASSHVLLCAGLDAARAYLNGS